MWQKCTVAHSVHKRVHGVEISILFKYGPKYKIGNIETKKECVIIEWL